MKIKLLFIITAILVTGTVTLNSQSLMQLGFIIKQAVPSCKTIAVMHLKKDTEDMKKQASKAQLVTRKVFKIFEISNKGEILTKLRAIYRFENVVVVIKSDDGLFNEESVKYIARKLLTKKISLVTTRAKDTYKGAMMSIFPGSDGTLEKHISMIVAKANNITIDPTFLKDCVIDIE